MKIFKSVYGLRKRAWVTNNKQINLRATTPFNHLNTTNAHAI